MIVVRGIEALAAPLDGVRRVLFRWALGVPALERVLTRRNRRIALQAGVAVLVALSATLVCPVALLCLSPAVLGVPHLASDLRYLVIRQPLERAWRITLVVGCASLFVLSLVAQLSAQAELCARLQMIVAAAWISRAAWLGAARRRTRGIATLLVAPASAAMVACPRAAQLALAHAHNLIAIAIWLLLFRRRRRAVALPLFALALGVALVCSPQGAALVARTGGARAFGVDLAQFASWLAPGLSGSVAIALTLSFALLQSVHYSLWLGLIPQEQVRGEASLTFRMSLRSLLGDLGAPGLAAIVGLVLLVGVASIFRLHATRELYLSLASFHGHLELATLVHLVSARVRQ